jgi:transketolase
MRDAFGEALVELGRVNPDVVALDADLASATKFSLFAEVFPERFYQIGIAEQNMASIAAGMATVGFIPFIGTFACFASCRIADQVRTSIAQPDLPVKIIGPYSGLLTGNTGKTHQAIEDIGLYSSIPNVTILSPADGTETGMAVHAMAKLPKPVYLRLARDASPLLFDQNHTFEIGRAYRLREGCDVTLISTGRMTATTLDAAQGLAEDGLEATVLHVPTIKPLDVEAVIDAAKQSECVVTVEEHNIYCGLGGAVAGVLSEYFPVPVCRFGIRDTFAESGANDAILEKYGLTAQYIEKTARSWFARWKTSKA